MVNNMNNGNRFYTNRLIVNRLVDSDVCSLGIEEVRLVRGLDDVVEIVFDDILKLLVKEKMYEVLEKFVKHRQKVKDYVFKSLNYKRSKAPTFYLTYTLIEELDLEIEDGKLMYNVEEMFDHYFYSEYYYLELNTNG